MQKISLKAIDIAQIKNNIYIFCYHIGRHLEYLKMLNDDKMSSFKFLNGKVLATRINQEKRVQPYFQVTIICYMTPIKDLL